MRQPNGRMSKKDRRAIQAFGLKPSEPEPTFVQGGHAMLLTGRASNGQTVIWRNDWNGHPTAVGANWYLSVDPGAITVTVQ